MKILQMCSYYVGTRLYEELFRAQAGQGVENTVYVPAARGDKVRWSTAPLPENVHFAPILGKYDRLFFHYKQRKILRDAEARFDAGGFQLIHAHSLFTNGYTAMRLKERHGVPYIVAVRNTDVNVFFRFFFWLRPVGRRIMYKAAGIIFINEPYRDAVLDKYIPEGKRDELRRRCLSIPNGIAREWLAGAHPSAPPEGKRLRIVYAGSIDKNKNLLATAQACQLLIDRGFDVRYTAVGRIDDRSEYEKLMRYAFVRYLPPQNGQGLRELYASQDIFVMPSLHETFGLVYAEAMTQGLPIIYTRGQGFDGQFEEGAAGYHVDARDPADIANKIMQILPRYGEMSANCAALSRAYDWDLIAARYAQLYRQAENGGI